MAPFTQSEWSAQNRAVQWIIEGSAMNISFKDQVALVTGAAAGMGLATARAFAESGAAVALADGM